MRKQGNQGRFQFVSARASALILAGSLVFQVGCRVSANFHEVDPGKFYRAAQLTKEEFQLAAEKLGIRTIINLRGASPDAQWYQDEMAVSDEFNIQHIDIGMSGGRIPHREDLVRLVEAYRDAPRPILVHCKLGADRTGEATAIYRMEFMGHSRKKALKALTPKYFHIKQILPAKRYFAGNVWKGMDWALNEYDPCAQGYKFYDKARFCGPDGEANRSPVELPDRGAKSSSVERDSRLDLE